VRKMFFLRSHTGPRFIVSSQGVSGCFPVCVSGCFPVCVSGCFPVCVSVCFPVCVSGCFPVCVSGCFPVRVTYSLHDFARDNSVGSFTRAKCVLYIGPRFIVSSERLATQTTTHGLVDGGKFRAQTGIEPPHTSNVDFSLFR